MLDLYQLLGIKRGATRAEVRKAYRRKAKTSHPDSGGSVEQFSALATAHEVLSDPRRREKYDTTGEIETAKPNNLDVGAIEVIAQKLGLIIHSEQDVTSMDVDALIQQAIREDITTRKSNIVDQERAIKRVVRLRARARRKGEGDNMLARVLDWHERSTEDLIKKNEESVAAMERALEILEGYSFAAEAPPPAHDEVSSALYDTIQALDELAAILNSQPKAAVG